MVWSKAKRESFEIQVALINEEFRRKNPLTRPPAPLHEEKKPEFVFDKGLVFLNNHPCCIIGGEFKNKRGKVMSYTPTIARIKLDAGAEVVVPRKVVLV